MQHLGAGSPAHTRAVAELSAIYAAHREAPAVKACRARWGFADGDELFVAHTLLALIAALVAEAVAGHGAAEAEFCGWVALVPGGERVVEEVAERVARFTWRGVEHDVLKGLYEGALSTSQRRRLGEFYTPDWLADRVVSAVVDRPLEQRVLDPACGSGTFLFHAIRRYLGAARDAGIAGAGALAGLTRHVRGTDIHPVAIAFARATYLLAIGPERLHGEGLPPLSIPVHLGDGLASDPERATVAADVLVGNPPWLSYRYMTRWQQKEVRAQSEARGLWAGGAVATNQDLATLFVLQSVERHLRAGGRFGFVVPWSVLRGRQHAGFRRGRYRGARGEELAIAFDRAWDLHAVRPTPFPVPSAVVFGARAEAPIPLPASVEAWSGRLPRPDAAWDVVSAYIGRADDSVVEAADAAPGVRSPYDARFVQGATILPRVLVVVEERGAAGGLVAVASRRSTREKPPWRNIAPLEGAVERRFVQPLVVSEGLLPYRTLEAGRAVIPWDGERLLQGCDARLTCHAGLSAWWREAERIWEAHRADAQLTLLGRLDYHRGLCAQLPAPPFRVVYGASGMYVAAALLEGDAVVEHGLYWSAVATREEGRYLEAVLNSEAVTRRIRPLQARGEHNPRHVDKLVWQLPIPLHDPDDAGHRRLADLAAQMEEAAARVALPEGKRNATLRGLVREALAASDAGRRIEVEVEALLTQSEPRA